MELEHGNQQPSAQPTLRVLYPTVAEETADTTPAAPSQPAAPAVHTPAPQLASHSTHSGAAHSDTPHAATPPASSKIDPEYVISIQVVDDLLRASHVLRGILSTHFAEFDLTDVRHSVLQIIRKAADQGCTQKELADRLHQSESSISTLIERMRQSGLLYRLSSRADRRKKVLMLSDRGGELLDKVDSCHGVRMDTLLNCFSSDRRDELAATLRTLADHLSSMPSNPEWPKPIEKPAAATTHMPTVIHPPESNAA